MLLKLEVTGLKFEAVPTFALWVYGVHGQLFRIKNPDQLEVRLLGAGCGLQGYSVLLEFKFGLGDLQCCPETFGDDHCRRGLAEVVEFIEMQGCLNSEWVSLREHHSKEAGEGDN